MHPGYPRLEGAVPCSREKRQDRIDRVVVPREGHRNLLPVLFIESGLASPLHLQLEEVELEVWNRGTGGSKEPHEK